MNRPRPLRRPAPDEYPSEYAVYLGRIPGDDVWPALHAQRDEAKALLAGVPDTRLRTPYASGKWTPKGVLGHLSDNERVFAYRALRFARNDPTPLANFDENLYVPEGRFDDRPISDLLEEFSTIRAATSSFLASLDDTALSRRGVARGVTVSARAMAWVIAGHVSHHFAVLRERYGLGAASR